MKDISFPSPLLRKAPIARAVTACLALVGAGCYSPPPSSDVTASISAMTGLDDLIEYKVVGEATDIEPDLSGTLTLDEAIRLALKHDPNVQIKLAQVRAALADAKQERLLPNPVLSVVFRVPEGGGKPEIEAGLSADLLSLLQMPRRISAADNRLRATSSAVLLTVLDAMSAVEERLVAVQAIDAQEAVLGERHRLIQRLSELARARLEAGEAARLDVLVLDAERVGVETEQLELRSQRMEQRLALARMLGRPSASPDWTLPALAADTATFPAERVLIEAALKQRPDVRAVQWELAALGDDAAITRWSWVNDTSVGVEAERDEGWAVGPGASVPVSIFDWGQARREKADAQIVEARHRLTQASRQVVEEVRQAVAARSAAVALIAKISDEFLPVAQRRHDQAEAQYRSGEADITALLQAEQQLLGARSRLIDAQRNTALANVRLQRALGARSASVPSKLAPRQLTAAPTTAVK